MCLDLILREYIKWQEEGQRAMVKQMYQVLNLKGYFTSFKALYSPPDIFKECIQICYLGKTLISASVWVASLQFLRLWSMVAVEEISKVLTGHQSCVPLFIMNYWISFGTEIWLRHFSWVFLADLLLAAQSLWHFVWRTNGLWCWWFGLSTSSNHSIA